jgi:hypothetical protein
LLRVPDPGEAVRDASEPERDDAVASKPAPGDPERPEEEFRRRAGRGARHIRKWLRGYEISGLAAESLDRLLDRCRDHGIQVILVVPPVTSIQRVEYTPDIESAFRAYVAGLTKRRGLRTLDFRARLPDDLFVDNHHTSAEGARTFSRMLAREAVGADRPALMPNP